MSKLVDVQRVLIELNDCLSQDFVKMDNNEIDDIMERIVRLEEHLVFNLVDYKVNNIRLIRTDGVKAVKAIREGRTTMSADMLRTKDNLAPLLLKVITKLDLIDSQGSLGSILLEVI